jgi:hypothetical protein
MSGRTTVNASTDKFKTILNYAGIIFMHDKRVGFVEI